MEIPVCHEILSIIRQVLVAWIKQCDREEDSSKRSNAVKEVEECYRKYLYGLSDTDCSWSSCLHEARDIAPDAAYSIAPTLETARPSNSGSSSAQTTTLGSVSPFSFVTQHFSPSSPFKAFKPFK